MRKMSQVKRKEKDVGGNGENDVSVSKTCFSTGSRSPLFVGITHKKTGLGVRSKNACKALITGADEFPTSHSSSLTCSFVSGKEKV